MTNKFWNKTINASTIDEHGDEPFVHPFSDQIKEMLKSFNVWVWGDWITDNKAFDFADPNESDLEDDMRMGLDWRSLARWEEGMWENIMSQVEDLGDDWQVDVKMGECDMPMRVDSTEIWPVEASVVEFVNIMLNSMDAAVYGDKVYLRSLLHNNFHLGCDDELLSMRECDLMEGAGA